VSLYSGSLYVTCIGCSLFVFDCDCIDPSVVPESDPCAVPESCISVPESCILEALVG